MPWENGVEWKPIAPEKRGRYSSFDGALAASLRELTTEHEPFFDSLADRWPSLFPDLRAIRPGRFDSGRIVLYVRNSPTLFMARSKLPVIRNRLMSLPDAPRRLDLRLEIHD